MNRSEDGFTLIELLVTLVVLPLLVGSIALATITLMKQTSTSDPKGVQGRLLDSHDAEMSSAYIVRDVESAVVVYPGNVMKQCGTGTELLGVWLDAGIASYSAYDDPTAGWELVRDFCSTGGGSESTTVISHDAFNPTTAPGDISATCPGHTTIWGYGCSNTADNGFVAFGIYDNTDCATSPCLSRVGYTGGNISKVTETVQTYSSAYRFSLSATPRLSTGESPSSTSTTPPTSVPTSTTTTTLPQQDDLSPPFLTFGAVSMQNCSATINGVAGVDDPNNGSVTVGSNGSFSASALYSTDTSDPSGVISPAQPGLSTTGGSPIPDPYAGLTAPSGSSFGGYNVVTETASPWTPSGNITGGAGGTIYIVQHGIKLSGNTGIVGNALIYVTGGSVDLTGGGNVTLSALSPTWENPVTTPAPPALPEPVIWVPSSNPTTVSLGGNGNATTINGAIYAPNSQVSLNGGGNSGGMSVQGLVAGSYACVGQDSLVAGNTLSSGTSNFPSVSTLSSGPSATLTDTVTVTGVGSLTPTGTVTIYECGPAATTGCSNSTGTSIGTAALSASGSGTATATSAAFHPTSAGSWCFAAYYGGSSSYNGSSDTSTDGCFTVSAPQTPLFARPVQGTCYYLTASSSCSTSPTPWPGTISGTATDTGGPGLTKVQIAIEAPNGKWWNGSNFVTSQTWQTATGTSSWSYPFPAFPTGNGATGLYTIEVYSTDTAGATSTAATLTFSWVG